MPTLIFEDKFETGGTWDTSAGTPTIVTTPVPVSSTRALECNAIGDYVFWNIADAGYTRCVLGVWVRLDTLPTVNNTRLFKIDSGPSEGWMKANTGGAGEPNIVGDGTPAIANAFSGASLTADTYTWMQVMFDLSANPWELRGKVGATVWSSTGAAAASNLNPGIFLLGNTAGGDTLTVYYSHVKAGVAADDNDWWDEPTAPTSALLLPLLGVG